MDGYICCGARFRLWASTAPGSSVIIYLAMQGTILIKINFIIWRKVTGDVWGCYLFLM